MSEENQRLELRVGGVALLSIIIVVAGVLWGKGVTDRFDQQAIEIHFPDAGGVTTSTPVFLNGVEVGSVTSIRVTSDHAVVRAHIEAGLAISDEATAVIRIRELTGGKKIELDPGDSKQPLAGAAIPGRNEGDIGELIAVAGRLSDQIEPIVRRTDTVLQELVALLGDPQLQADVRTAAAEFAEAGGRANGLLAEVGPDLGRSIEKLERLTDQVSAVVETNRPAFDRIVASTDAATSSAVGAVAEGRDVLAKLDRVARDLEVVARTVRDGGGFFGTLLYDDTMSKSLEQTIEVLRRFIDDIRKKGVNVNVELGHE